MPQPPGEFAEGIGAAAVELHDRLRALDAAIGRVVTGWETAGATAAELAELDLASEHLTAILTLGDAALTTIEQADIRELVEPDPSLNEEEVYGIVRRFTDREGGGFTVAELKAHLKGLGVVLPEDSRQFTQLFANWREDILAEKTEAGERRQWVKLGPRRHVLAWVQTAAGEPSSAAPALPPPPQPVRRPAPTLPVEPEARPDRELALRLVADLPDERAKVVVDQLARELAISSHEARAVCDELIATGQLYRRRVQGSLHYTLEEPTPVRRRPERPRPVDTETTGRPSEAQVQAAQLVLRLMSGRGAHVTKALTPQEVVRLAGERVEHHGLNVTLVKSVASYLQSLGLVERVQARQGTKRARAKRLEVMKLRIKDQAVMNALKSSASRAAVLGLVERGEPFIAESPEGKA